MTQHSFGRMPMQSLTPDEDKLLKDYLKENDLQDWAIWCLIQEGFFRISEVLALRAGDITADGRIYCHRGKNSGPNILPIMDEQLLVMIRHQVSKCATKSTPLFNRPRRTFDWRLKQAGKALGLPVEKMHAHAGKHTACQQALVDTDGRIFAVKTLAGHKSILSTLKYTVMSTEQALKYREDKHEQQGCDEKAKGAAAGV